MKQILIFACFFGLTFPTYSQTGNYPQWQHPILQQLRVNSKNLIPYYKKDSTAFVTVSVVDKKEKIIYWFDCFGYYFDAVPISDKNMQALFAKKTTAFKYYDLITNDYLNTIIKARLNFQNNGNKAIFTAYEKQLLQIDDSIKFPSTLKKLIELDKQKLSVERQIREFHSINPTMIKEDTTFSKTLALQYGSMETSYLQRDSVTTYYNRIALEPVYKAVLNNSTASVQYFNRGNQLIDEIQFDTNKVELLRKEKIDLFLLYRGWLEMQRYYIIENVANIKIATKELNESKSRIDIPQFINTRNNFQTLLRYSSQLLKSTNYKIDYLTTIDRGFVSQCLKKQYQQTTNSLSAGEAYLSTFTRGDKFYELTDARGNVMAVVTDKKIQHSSNGTTVDYYEPDIVSATDYAPFGSPLPGRNYQSDKYRYGYNGKENDNEVKGQGNQQDYGMRIYDPRLGRFLSVDPLGKNFPWNSPYSFAENDVIRSVDLDGLEKYFVIYYSDNDHLTSIQIFRAEDLKGKLINMNISDAIQKIDYSKSNKLIVHYNTQTKTVESTVTNNEELNKLENGILQRVDPKNAHAVRSPNTNKFEADGPKDPKHDYAGEPGLTTPNPSLLSNSFHFNNASGFTTDLSRIKNFNISKIDLPVEDYIKTGDLNLNSAILVFKTQADLNKYGEKFAGLLKDKFGADTKVKTQVNKNYIDKTSKKDNKKYNFFVVLQTSEKK